jgi:hypothetical protein
LRFAGDHDKNRRGAFAPRRPWRDVRQIGVRAAALAGAASRGAGIWSIRSQSEVEIVRGDVMVELASQSTRPAPPARSGEGAVFASAIEDIISIGTGKSGLNAIERVFGE